LPEQEKRDGMIEIQASITGKKKWMRNKHRINAFERNTIQIPYYIGGRDRKTRN